MGSMLGCVSLISLIVATQMHNLNRSSHNVDHGITHTKKGLSQDKKDFIDNQNLKDNHLDYDNKASNGTLNTLSPKWTEAQTSEREIAYDLYGSTRPIIRNHWAELQRNNGNVAIVCPFCGLTDAEEMDHFIPRGKEKLFPEYSTHYSNLIPLCHNCNHSKGDDWIEDGQQVFFNAYFDHLDGIEILRCDISRDPSTGLVFSTILLNITGHENDICRRVVNTITRLKLLPRFSKDSNKILRSKTMELKTEYEQQNSRYADLDDYVGAKRDVINSMSSNADDFIAKLTYSAIVDSDDYWNFVKSQL